MERKERPSIENTHDAGFAWILWKILLGRGRPTVENAHQYQHFERVAAFYV